MPNGLAANKFHFKFIGYTDNSGGTTNGKIVEPPDQTIAVTGSTGTSGSISLETGWWRVEVTRYADVNSPVQTGTSPYFEIKAGAATGTSVSLAAVSGVTGVFSHTITLTSYVAGSTASLLVQQIGTANAYGFSSVALTGSNLQGSLTLPAGTYDVSVVVTRDGKSASLYDTVIIYPGLTSTGTFTFNSNQFYTNVYIGGTLSISPFPSELSGPSGNNVTITACKPGTNTQIGTPVSFVWSSSQPNWIIPIDTGNTSAELTVQITGADGKTYTSSKLTIVDAIPVNGKFGISLPTGIYKISPDVSWPSLNTYNAKVNNIDRTYACKGEEVTLSNITSSYGFLQGSLKVKKAGSEIPLSSGSVGSYSFIMPDGDVSLNADFHTAELSLSILSTSGTVQDTYTFSNPAVSTYDFPAIKTSSIFVTGTAANCSVSISPQFVSLNDDSYQEVTITVTPLQAVGGTNSYREYKVRVIGDDQ